MCPGMIEFHRKGIAIKTTNDGFPFNSKIKRQNSCTYAQSHAQTNSQIIETKHKRCTCDDDDDGNADDDAICHQKQ